MSNKQCSRCQAPFVCLAEDIANCGCTSIRLQPNTINELQTTFDDCLCNACLAIYQQQEMKNAVEKEKAEQKRNAEKEERIKNATTRIFKAVFPNTTNHYDTLFGGTALQLMDEVAFICATRFARKRMVTVSSDRVDFEHPIPAGTLIELVATVNKVGNTSLVIQVDIFVEQMYSDERQKAISGSFTFVAIDEHKKPIKVL